MAWPKGRPRKPKTEPDPAETEGLERLDALGFLKLDAERQADGMGHALENWQDRKGDWAEAACVVCGGKAAVALHPPPGSPGVQLEARLRRECA